MRLKNTSRYPDSEVRALIATPRNIEEWMAVSACPHCGGRVFRTGQEIVARQTYHAASDTWDSAEVMWDSALTIWVDCDPAEGGCGATLWEREDPIPEVAAETRAKIAPPAGAGHDGAESR